MGRRKARAGRDPKGRPQFAPQGCVSRGGSRKIRLTREEALAEAKYQGFIHGTEMVSYECPQCGSWHLTKARRAG